MPAITALRAVAPQPRPQQPSAAGGAASQPIPRLIGDARISMVTPPGPRLSLWMRGAPLVSSPAADPAAPTLSPMRLRALQRQLDPAILSRCAERNIPLGYVASALERRVTPEDLDRLLSEGAGAQAFAFLHYVGPYCDYWSPLRTASRLLGAWPRRAPVVFERLVRLARSPKLQNPEQLKSWVNGMAGQRNAAEGYATMLNDALDLVEAGHEVYLEQHPQGLGDIIDATTKIAYQHKRVSGRHLREKVLKAAEQLEGFLTDDGRTIAGAPPGFSGIVQIDLRANPHFTSLADIERQMPHDALKRYSRVFEVQVLTDDALHVFDAAGKHARTLTETKAA